MKQLLGVFMIVTAVASCNKQKVEKGTPRCVENRIEDFEKSSACDDAKVLEYSFQNSAVFVFEPGTCGADMTSEVINTNCEVLGHLGGISGNTKINGEEFSNAVFVKTTWEK